MTKNSLTRAMSVTAAVVAVFFCSSLAQAATATVARFSDPSLGGGASSSMFTVDFLHNTTGGGWQGSGLDLEIPWISPALVYTDASFAMTPLAIQPGGDIDFATTGPGTVQFFSGDTHALLLQIAFDGASLSDLGLSGTVLQGNTVQITIPGVPITLTDQASFTFDFANLVPLYSNQPLDDGFTATAAFTSSAAPEPAAVAGLLLGGIPLVFGSRRGLRR